MEAVHTNGAGKGQSKWYDSGWFDKFIEARPIVARVAPERLDDFEHAFDVLRPPPGYSRQRC
jgi:hypothetical protein